MEVSTNQLSLFSEEPSDDSSTTTLDANPTARQMAYRSIFENTLVTAGLLGSANVFSSMNSMGIIASSLLARRLTDTVLRSPTTDESSAVVERPELAYLKFHSTNLLRLQRTVTPSFLQLCREESFEFGFESPSEMLVRTQLKVDPVAARTWLSKLFVERFHDSVAVIGILRVIGRLSEKEIFPDGQTMAGTALSYDNDEVKELGVRAFENWGSKTSWNMLRNIHTGTKWLDDYIEEVVADLSDKLCLS